MLQKIWMKFAPKLFIQIFSRISSVRDNMLGVFCTYLFSAPARLDDKDLFIYARRIVLMLLLLLLAAVEAAQIYKRIFVV